MRIGKPCDLRLNEALKLDPKSTSALNGLAMCSFDKMEVGRAEELFRKAMKVEPNDCAGKMLKKIELLRKGEPWAKRAEARRKFWKHWQDTELTKMSDEQRRKRMAEVVVNLINSTARQRRQPGPSRNGANSTVPQGACVRTA